MAGMPHVRHIGVMPGIGKEILETFSKGLPSSTNLETLAEQLADQLSGLDP